MEFMKYRVKVMENFKDGNILDGRFLRANEILIISESDFAKVTNSGGVLEILESLIPNPKKELPEVVEAKEAQAEAVEEEEVAQKAEIAQAEETIQRAEPKKRGRKPKAK